jgi:N-carbamoylputrescine amidase
MTEVTVAATQFAVGPDRGANVDKAVEMVRRAAAAGADIVLLQELFEGPYFCKDQDPAWFEWARPAAGHDMLARMSALAAELGVVLPVSFFERENNAYYNSVAVIDADGRQLGLYRKSHIPDGPGYQEKFYFRPGDTGFKVWPTRFGRIGIGICWDQWFPETARSMALQGAELLFYPTAIGSEPQDPTLDSRDHWQRVMQGHAGANLMPLVASNRIGHEQGAGCATTFYGSSFIAGPTGEKLAEADRAGEAVLTARFDLDRIRRQRNGWGVFRDRRPELYGALATADGSQVFGR